MSGLPAGLNLIEGTFGAEGCLVTEASLAQTRGFHTHLAGG